MSNAAQFDVTIQGIDCVCVVDHYLPATPDTHDAQGAEEEMEIHLETADGNHLDSLTNRMDGDDIHMIYNRYAQEMAS